MRKTKEDAAKTRQMLIDAGLKVLHKKGYSAIRLEDIAREVNMTRGAIYWHFKNKTELFQALVDESVLKIRQIMNEVISSEFTPLEKINVILTKFLSDVNKQKVFHDISVLATYRAEMSDEMKVMASQFSDLFRNTVELMTSLCEAGKQKGEIRKDVHSQNFALNSLIYMHGAMSISLERKKISNLNIFDISNNAESLINTLLSGIKTI